ncbi:MAG: LLM class flavin-dependent oxidoreductase [Actinomycetia bacterium]|nr:LLM class flavin-dependent oxidoreductase [Actinomycetes bacterium]MCP5033751.1 LLM class flavin-dependent oxidoreductase [Actinomycetes bacterium]
MRIGISISSSLTADSPARAAGWMVERAAAAYAAGLSSLSVGDHHGQPGWYMQNTPILGRLLAEWPDRPAGCLFLVPLWPPLIMAEHIGTLASLVDAPFIVQVGIGTGRRQFASLGADLSTRGRNTDEAITIAQALLAGEEVHSEILGMGPTTLALRPTQQVEWWIGGHVPATLRRAAKLGTAWYGGPGLDQDQSSDLIDAYRQCCQAEAAVPRSIARRDALVLDNGDRARAEAKAIIDKGYRGIDTSQLLIGEPAEVGEQVAGLAALGYDDVIIRCMSGDQASALETIAKMGEVNAAI